MEIFLNIYALCLLHSAVKKKKPKVFETHAPACNPREGVLQYIKKETKFEILIYSPK